MRTKLMTRVYNAIVNGENPILDQLEHDITSTREKGSLYTREYSISKFSDDLYFIDDKVNKQVTVAIYSDSDKEIKLGHARDILEPGDEVKWTDNSGNVQTGKWVTANDNISKVKSDQEGKLKNINTMLLTKSTDEPKSYSKTRNNLFLVDEKGNVQAHGWMSSLVALKQMHPTWKIISRYDWNAIQNGIKNLRQFSLPVQKAFTRSTRRYAVVDKKGKFLGVFDVTNARGIIAKNPGSTMMKERVWNQLNQPKIKGFSNQQGTVGKTKFKFQ